MKKFTIKFLSIFLAISVLICTFNIPVFASDDIDDSIDKVYCEATLDDEFTDNEILILVTPDNNFKEYTISDFSDIGCIEIEDLTIEPKEGELCRIFLLTLSIHSKQNVLYSIKMLEERKDIYSVEPNYIIPMDQISTTTQSRVAGRHFSDIINLDEAWNIEAGRNSVSVGVIDSGIDASHPNLANRVDQILSKNFGDKSKSATSELVNNHGTYVAGIIGAHGNNAYGVTGVCQNVNLVSLRVDSLNNGYVVFEFAAIINAISYANEKGIDVLNFSIGNYNLDIFKKEILRNKIETYNGLFVCSAGNENIDTDNTSHYPSIYRLNNLISVGASTAVDMKNSDSNYGKTTVDIFAPGENINSTSNNGGFDSASGTSVASPIIAGVAALLLSIHPELTATELKSVIMSSVDIIYSNGNNVFGDLCVSGGRINAYKALSSDLTHNYSFQNTGNHITHTYSCSGCGYTNIENHPMLINSIDSNTHRCSCSECGYEIQQNHTMTYAYVDSGTHYYKCTICAYRVQQNHTWIYTSVDSREHKVKCIYNNCGFEYTEKHTLNLLTGKCKICGYDSNGIGTLNRLLGLM